MQWSCSIYFFSSILQIWLIEIRISRSIFEIFLDFEILRVDCTFYSFKQYFNPKISKYVERTVIWWRYAHNVLGSRWGKGGIQYLFCFCTFIAVFSHHPLFLSSSLSSPSSSVYFIHFLVRLYIQSRVGLGGSVGCAVRLETRRSRVQPPPRSATVFRGDWAWNIFYGHSLPSADSRRAVVSFWRKNVHNTG